MDNKKTTIPSLRNVEWRIVKTETNKIKQVVPYISTNSITELNEVIYAGNKLVWKKIGIPSQSSKKIKTRKGNSTGNANKKSTKRGQNDIKQRKDAGIRRNKKEKGHTQKIIMQLEEINQISIKGKAIGQNRIFQNNERRFNQQLGGDDTKTHQ